MRSLRRSKPNPNNTTGQASGFLCMTAIEPGQEDALRAYLQGFRDRDERPMAKVPGTHMARFVIVEKFNCKPSYKQRKPETLACASLAFSSNLDGPIDAYLDVLCERLQPEAREIWGRCCGAPDPCEGQALKDYLKHNQVDCGFFYAAYGSATVQQVQDSLAQRDRLMDFATRNQGVAPDKLQKAFLKEFA
ncbi:MAG: hypothetical protein QOG94_3503 [Solirubrobacteraceae bacterium]|jgi:hypothetical protein|nr:hypothetical protein [Solirubrobacteraceae bacterium]